MDNENLNSIFLITYKKPKFVRFVNNAHQEYLESADSYKIEKICLIDPNVNNSQLKIVTQF